jgi:hypothetical protein
MDYTKIGPLSKEVVELAKSKGYGSVRLVVAAWEPTKLKLNLMCFKEKVNLVKHTLYNDDTVVYEVTSDVEIYDPNVFELVVRLTYDRINNTYSENYRSVVHRINMLLETEDPAYNGIRRVVREYDRTRMILAKEDIQRSINTDRRTVKLIEDQIADMDEEDYVETGLDSIVEDVSEAVDTEECDPEEPVANGDELIKSTASSNDERVISDDMKEFIKSPIVKRVDRDKYVPSIWTEGEHDDRPTTEEINQFMNDYQPNFTGNDCWSAVTELNDACRRIDEKLGKGASRKLLKSSGIFWSKHEIGKEHKAHKEHKRK